MPTCQCKNCDKSFHMKNAEIKRGEGKFCSRNCYLVYYKNKNLRKCLYCGKSFSAFDSEVREGRKFCSNICVGAYYSGKNSPFWMGGEKHRTCIFCRKEFFVRNFKINYGYGKFCSRKCMGYYNSINFSGKNSFNYKLGHPPIENKCRSCGNIYYIFPFQIGRSKFCSSGCRAIDTLINMPNKETSIERIVRLWLDEINIDYEAQHVVPGITITDFFIEPNIAIYCDGRYWHSKLKAINRDCFVNRSLTEKGYRLLRLKEDEIIDRSAKIKLLDFIEDVGIYG